MTFGLEITFMLIIIIIIELQMICIQMMKNA